MSMTINIINFNISFFVIYSFFTFKNPFIILFIAYPPITADPSEPKTVNDPSKSLGLAAVVSLNILNRHF